MVRIETTMCSAGSLFLGRIVYHIDTLVQEWYQGLLGKSIRGNPKVEYLVPCKLCRSEGLPQQNFSLQDLVDAGEVGDDAVCPNNHRVDIGSLAPDVMLRDFGDKVIGENDIEIKMASSLGKGTQGSVCVGSLGGVKVAVKMFGSGSKEQDYEEQPHYQLRQEGCILRLLNHPSIVRFVGVVHRPRCIVLELAEYGSLDSLIKNSPLSRTFTHRVLIQVSEGLDYLHRQNIIFRDLKPQNILIVSKDMGVPLNAKLSDFGVSGLTTDEGLLSFAGTTGYMAPNITGKHIYDTSVDVFSFGILIRELLTGKRVLSELNFPKQIAGAFMDGKATLQQETGWYDLTQVLNECVNPNPEERPSALEVTDILSRADTLCLRSIHSSFQDQECSLKEYIILNRGSDTQLWAKVRISESCHARYGVSVISLQTLSVIKTIVVPEYEEFICICSFTRQRVFLGGARGKVVVLNTHSLSVECVSHIPAAREDLHGLNILSMVALDGLDTPLLVMGLGNGQLYIFSEDDVSHNLESCHLVVTVEKNKPVTKVASCADHLLAASHQIIHVFNGEFDKIYVFDMEDQRAQTHITKMCVVGSSVWVALHNSNIVQVCRFKRGSGGNITSMEADKRKAVDVIELVKELPLPSADPGPSFSVFHSTVTHVASSFDMRITCMVKGENCIFLGLGNGMLLQVDTATYKLKFLCKRHKGALRVIVPHGSHDVATFGDEVLDLRGNVIPSVTACSWNIGEQVETLNRYLHARKAMVRL